MASSKGMAGGEGPSKITDTSSVPDTPNIHTTPGTSNITDTPSVPGTSDIPDTPSDTLTIDPKLPQNYRRWNRDNVKKFLEDNSAEYIINQDHINILWQSELTGRDFSKLTLEELKTGYGLPHGLASRIKELITALVKPSQLPTVSPTVSRTDLEELHRLRGIVEKIKYPSHTFKLIVPPKTKTTIDWTVDINTATLAMLSAQICEEYSEYENSALLFIFTQRDGQTHKPQTDEALQKLLRFLIAHGEMTVKLSLASPAKPFSDWTLSQVMRLYEIGDPSNPDITHFPCYQCNRTPIDKDHILPDLVKTLQGFLLTTSISASTDSESARSVYVHSFLNATILDFVSGSQSKFSIKPERNIEGLHGKGPVDYAIEITASSGIVGVTEVKREDFKKGVAQNAVQIESVLWKRKRKADEISAEADGVTAEVPILRCFGIITDAREWMFLECSYDSMGKPKFRLSRVYSVSYGKGTMKEDVKEILERIKWLLTEATATVTAAAPAPASNKKLKT